MEWNGILRERGGFLDWNSEGVGGGGNAVGIPKAWGGDFSSESSEFPEGRRRKLRLKSLTEWTC